MRKRIRVGDMFCGMGGSSEAARQVLEDELGLSMDLLAVNHWRPAIEAHRRNHPKAETQKADVYRMEPLEAVPSGELDLLMASPTCVYNSRARGGRPTSWDQRYGRMTPTQVERWCKTLKVKALVVENVPEFISWGPVCQKRTACAEHGWAGPPAPDAQGQLWTHKKICGKPRKEAAGVYFRAWVKRLERAGFVCEWRVLKAADYGDATTRERFFMLARSDGQAIQWPDKSHASREKPVEGRKRWRAAREIINWKIRGRSIFGREKPLAAKTLLRIYAGLIRFCWPAPFVRKLRLYMESLGISVPSVVAPRTRRPSAFVMLSNQQGGNGANVRSADDPAYTVTTDGGMALVEPFGVVCRSSSRGRPGGERFAARSLDDPAPTICAGGTHVGLVQGEFTFQMNQAKDRARGLKSVDEPLGTIVAKECRGLVAPFIVPQGSNTPARSVDEPVPTVVAVARMALIEPGPFVLSQGAGGAPRSTEEPVPTIPTEGAHALIAPYYGASDCASVEAPLGTVTTRDRFGLVTPVTHHDASNRVRSVEEPLPTITSAARGELAFITAAFGERPGQAERVRSVEEPIPTVLAQGRIPLVQGDATSAGRGVVEAEDLSGIDILFRMLAPRELASAMGFPKRYKLQGTKTDVTRMIGNAVPVNTAAALVRAVMASFGKVA